VGSQVREGVKAVMKSSPGGATGHLEAGRGERNGRYTRNLANRGKIKCLEVPCDRVGEFVEVFSATRE